MTSNICGYSKLSQIIPKKYKSLYVGDVNVPQILESVINGITVKVIDIKKTNLDLTRGYSVDNLRFLPACLAVDNSPAIDIYYHLVNGLKYLTKITGRLNFNEKDVLIAVFNIDKLENAYFNGEFFVFGNGGNSMKTLVSADVVFHELTHMLCESICGLEYKGESGALNESFSDVLATGYEFYLNNPLDIPDFQIGEMIMKDQPFLRNMTIPRKYRDVEYVNPSNLDLDLGGVHINSAIPNYLFYKIVTELGLDKMNELLGLWYRVYCRLPKNCSMLQFGEILTEETPNKWINKIKGVLVSMDLKE